MCRVRCTPRVLILMVMVLLGFSGTAFGQIPAITSNGSLGAISWWDGYYTVILNTDAMSIDVSTFHGGYSVGGGCPWGTYSPDPALNRCARLVPQSGGPDIVVYDFTTVSIGQNNVYVAGTRPAAIAATGTITIAGAITMNNGYAGGSSPDTCPGGGTGCGAGHVGSGPGGGGGGAGPGGYVGSDPLAGGGGGAGGGAGAGAKGGNSRTLVDANGTSWMFPGGAAGPGNLVAGGPLRAGSGGGSGGDRGMWGGPQTYGGAGGGAGGGALILAAPSVLTLSGTLSADGKPGAASNGGGGGGGGGGGFIAIQAASLVLQASGTISAVGGLGGVGPGGQMNDSYGGRGGGGLISIQTQGYLNQGTVSVAGGTVGVIAGGASDDADHDGLPDTWEGQMGLNPAVATGEDGPDGDPDADGKTNVQEYLAGTHPRGFYTRYFAEGAIIPGFFEVDLALLNVDPVADGHVWLRYQKGRRRWGRRWRCRRGGGGRCGSMTIR